MERTNLFLSYSHRDRGWLERLKAHLALLQRRGLVHVWSDTRIGVGDRWQEEIEDALTESRAAVLVISPDFLASDFIWEQEMPRIMAHQEAGMAVLPLIARPCAWRIAPELAALQARPEDGRALALGTEAEIDLALAEFVYELAARLEQMPATIASEEADRMRARRAAPSEVPVAIPASAGMYPSRTAVDATAPIERGQTWTGIYHPTERPLRLVVRERMGMMFRGNIEYTDDGSTTDVDGVLRDIREGTVPEVLHDVRIRLPDADATVTFSETRIVQEGRRPPQLGGEYIGLVSGPSMEGVWQSSGSVQGRFELRLEA